MSTELVLLSIVISIGVCVIGVVFYLLTGLDKKMHDQSRVLHREMHLSLTDLHQELRHHTSLFQEAQNSIGERLEGAAFLVAEVQNRLGQLEEANRRILEVGANLGKEVGHLQDIFQAPKIRGEWGEFFLGNLLEEVLGPEHYELQYPFKNGDRVDAVVKLAEGIVPVDAKFPLENFRRSLAASGDSEQKTFRKEFYKDIRRHIDQIAEKYIVPDEGTMDFALMYIPAENIYYETIIRDESLGEAHSISEYAQMKKVIPVSPNTLYVYLSSIARGLQGLRVESHAREILANLQRLGGDLAKFDEEFCRMGGHLKNAASSYERASRQLDRLHDRVASSETFEAVKPEEKITQEQLSQ